MRKGFKTLCFTSLIATCSVASSTDTITQVKFYQNLAGIYFTQKTVPHYNTIVLRHPDRLVLDFPNTRLANHFRAQPAGIVKSFHYHVYSHKTRLVFSLPGTFTYSKTTEPHHLKLTIHTQSAQTPQKPLPAVVVIDPGHGGKDPGATGPKGIHEKNVVLAMGKDLRADLKNMAGIKVDMTRHGDYFVTLRGRLQIARKDKADVFIAIHADSFPNKNARGATVFALSEHGATSEAARWLAHSENNAVLGGAQFADQSKEVRSVLLDLSQSITIAHSLEFGKDVNDSLAKVTPMHSGKVEQAPFMVLKSPDIPSLLVETGFISNVHEEAELNNPKYQHAMAQAMAKGIREYLYQHPPRHSIIAEQQAGHLHYTVKKGDTLKKLAAYFNVTEKALARANDLSIKAALKPGKSLTIPRA